MWFGFYDIGCINIYLYIDRERVIVIEIIIDRRYM